MSSLAAPAPFFLCPTRWGDRPLISRSLDRLLGPGAVTVGPTNSLRLDDAALSAQLHRPSPRNGVRCFCLACRAERQVAADALNAEPAPAPAGQPWEPRPSKAST